MMEPIKETIKAADQQYLRAILDQRSLLLGYINAIVRDLHAAEDILQESLVLATQKKFNDEQHAHAWIRATARNLSFNELRRQARRPATINEEVFSLLEPVFQELADEGHHQGTRLEALRSCISGLSSTAQEQLHLRFREGLDAETIATRMKRPLNTIYIGLSRSYRRLADCIGRRLKEAT